MKLMVFCAALVFAANASAEWSKDIIEDKMRGTSRAVFMTEAKPIEGSGPSVELRMIDESDGRPGIVFTAKDAAFEKCPSFCDVEFRFDDGKVKRSGFVSNDGRFTIPSETGSFAGAIKLSKELFIELGIAGGTKRQYRFDVSGLPIEVSASPEVNILGYFLGRRYSEAEIKLTKDRETDGVTCYLGGDQEKPFGKQAVSKVSLCFSGGYFRTALITPGNKAAYSEGASFLTKTFGSMDKESIMPRWPKHEWKVIEKETKTATYFSSSKNDYKSLFIISDGVSDLLAQ